LSQGADVLRNRRLIAFICVIALLAVALAPATSAVPHAVLVPLDPLFGLVIVGEFVTVVPANPYSLPFVEVTGSRPPPSL
jgi:hypothetical protein